jgi:hypothetical protein
MGNNKMIKALYKSLFRLAQKFDNNTTSKALLYRPPPSSSSADSVFRSASQIHFNAILDKILGRQRLFYHPSRMDQSLKAIVRKEFRNSKSKISLNSRLDVGFSLLRQVSTLWVNYEQEVQYRAAVDSIMKEHSATALLSSPPSPSKQQSNKKKKESKLDVTPAPVTVQAGVLLAAHPMLHGDMHRSLVLVVEHSEEHSYGVVLNKALSQSQHTVRSGVSGVRVEGFYEAFGVSGTGYIRALQSRMQCVCVCECVCVFVSVCVCDLSLYIYM